MKIISPDSHLYKDGQYVWTEQRAYSAWKSSYSELEMSLRAEKSAPKVVMLCGLPGAGKSTWLSQQVDESSIFFDATFANRKARKEFVQFVKKVRPDSQITLIKFQTPYNVCVKRNNERPTDRKVPDSSMERMKKNLEDNPPEESEGFKIILIGYYG